MQLMFHRFTETFPATWLYVFTGMEVFSQTINALHHSGNADETFSARLGGIRDGSQRTWILPRWYWRSWIWFFETCFPGHLDWAMTED